MDFKLTSDYKPAGDQPQAIEKLVAGLKSGHKMQTLLGVTGSGKTFTVANVIQQVQKPTLILAHNKTLAAQLCNEFREFFPENAVEYFVSYYDYYQPEAYVPSSDTYIEKEAMINQEIDRLRHATTQALLTRRDCIIVASVSCIYGLGAPEAYEKTLLHFKAGERITREALLQRFIDMQFTRTTADLTRGQFRLRGETLEVMPASEEFIYRIETGLGEIKGIYRIDPVTRKRAERVEDVWIFPAKHFITGFDDRKRALVEIEAELKQQLEKFKKEGKLLEAERIERRTRFDMAMLKEVGFCHGIENYSRILSGRPAGAPPDTLLSYFPKDFMLVIDESHVTIPQVGGMSAGDAARKKTLIDYGFRLPSAADNRPLTWKEFEERMPPTLFVSATPGKYEAANAAQTVEQIIRPTGLVDPEVIVMPVTERKADDAVRKSPNAYDLTPDADYPGQVEDLIARIKDRVKKDERVMATTLTKKMAEDLTQYLETLKVKVKYIHSDVQTLDRIQILHEFRKGVFDVLIGVNLLREGLDLPEVSLVAILDADKEGFLRSETSLIQTIGRAARNVGGQVVLYADGDTGSLTRAIRETNRRRERQLAWNAAHGITPKTIRKSITSMFTEIEKSREKAAKKNLQLETAVDHRPVEELLREKEGQMREAARSLEFELAALLRDEIAALKKKKKAPAVPKKAGGKGM
ncbi:MAG TPA: excinuclease ABC subunit UvrB [Candidatus Baltobacteraceae bacterium]|nr:excinuclease ABC subunit UvrB [Candidatus Baltobacteraceae bacterium]